MVLLYCSNKKVRLCLQWERTGCLQKRGAAQQNGETVTSSQILAHVHVRNTCTQIKMSIIQFVKEIRGAICVLSSFCSQNIIKQMGDEKLQKFINFVLGKLSQLTLPVKRWVASIFLFMSITVFCSYWKKYWFSFYAATGSRLDHFMSFA